MTECDAILNLNIFVKIIIFKVWILQKIVYLVPVTGTLAMVIGSWQPGTKFQYLHSSPGLVTATNTNTNPNHQKT